MKQLLNVERVTLQQRFVFPSRRRTLHNNRDQGTEERESLMTSGSSVKDCGRDKYQSKHKTGSRR